MAVLSNLVFGDVSKFPGTTTPSNSTHTVDASDDGFAVVFCAPKDGSISKLVFHVSALNGTSPAFRAAVEGVAAGIPDGTVGGGGSPASATGIVSVGLNEFTLDNALTVSAGAFYAATFRHSSGTIDGSNNVVVNIAQRQHVENSIPHHLTLAGGTWSIPNNQNMPIIGIVYSDGEYVGGTITDSDNFAGISVGTWSSGGSPVYRGLLWKPNFAGTLAGAYVVNRTENRTYDVKVFKGSSGTVLATSSVPSREIANYGQSYAAGRRHFFDPVSFVAGDALRIVVEATDAAGITYEVVRSFADAESLAAMNDGMFYCTADSPGTWTDYDNVSDGFRATTILPILSEIVTGGGGASSLHPLTNPVLV
jgi:hypothetical protein